MNKENTVYGWSPRNRPIEGPRSFIVPVTTDNGKITYSPINKNAGFPNWNDGVEISTYCNIGASTAIRQVPNSYYIVGPTYCKNGTSTDSRITITGKALASVPERDGKLCWKCAKFEKFEDAINRELQEEVGLSIKPEYINSVRKSAIIVRNGKYTAVTVMLTMKMLMLYDPDTMEGNVFTNNDKNILKDNRNYRVQIILTVEKDNISKLLEINHRRKAKDTDSIMGLCIIPKSRLMTLKTFDHCEIMFDKFEINNLTFKSGTCDKKFLQK